MLIIYETRNIDVPANALPDLNTAYIFYRTDVKNSIKSENFTGMVGSLFDLNALLPKEYQIKISTKEYNDLIRQDLTVICNHCLKSCEHCKTNNGELECIAESKYHDIIIKQVITPYLLAAITGEETEKLWECKRCNNNNLLSKTKMIQNVIAQPYYLKVIPNPPNRKDGFSDRTEYKIKMKNWGYQFLIELEHQMSLYRIEYKPKDEDNAEFVTDGMENQDI